MKREKLISFFKNGYITGIIINLAVNAATALLLYYGLFCTGSSPAGLGGAFQVIGSIILFIILMCILSFIAGIVLCFIFTRRKRTKAARISMIIGLLYLIVLLYFCLNF